MTFSSTQHTRFWLALGASILALCSYAVLEFTKQDSLATPDFGPNVRIFDPSMPSATVQAELDHIFRAQESNQFGNQRYAILFKPGVYHNTVRLGFYTQVMGLGTAPDTVTLHGGVSVDAGWFHRDATQNFWRSVENIALIPTDGTMRWAVAQAAPMRRVLVQGNMLLDDEGWSSGGFIADSWVDGKVSSGMQQQWLSRNARFGEWEGANWNMVFVGVENAPSAVNWPNPAYSVIEQVPVVREKPFLTIDAQGRFSVFVPELVRNGRGVSWHGKSTPGHTIPIHRFHIARAEVDTAASLNAALAEGKHLLLTPGVYRLDDTLRVTSADTVVLGLGLASLQAATGKPAMTVADVEGVKLAGILFDAGSHNSPVLLQVGSVGSHIDHANNPISLHDLFFRVGGAGPAHASLSLQINSQHVIGDDLWLWRADHGTGVGWEINTTRNGLEVNGDHVTLYGLAVEHFHQIQTLWNGNHGRLYFYQSEIPYDVPDQASWMNGSLNGYASYKVADTVTHHEATGLGIYCFFDTNPLVKLTHAIEIPVRHEVGESIVFRDITTVSLGGTGEITHVLNQRGDTVNSANQVARLAR